MSHVSGKNTYSIAGLEAQVTCSLNIVDSEYSCNIVDSEYSCLNMVDSEYSCSIWLTVNIVAQYG